MISPTGKPFSVTEISTLIRNHLERTFGNVEIEGEVTDYRGANSSGHHYFSLKDAQSRINIVLFSGRAASLRLRIENGKKVRVEGKLSSFAGTSRYQIIATTVVDIGIGDLAVKFEEMKRRLEAEGLFAKEHKKALPLLPRHIGVVTSPTGSVIRDFLNVLSRRYPNIDILIAPAKVQGEGAAEEIASGVRLLGEVGKTILTDLPPREVIVVMRGGGSMEELWCFNEEIVARAIFEAEIPIISGVGHETDFTICDFVADLRAPTPSAAAEQLVRPKADFERDVSRLAERSETLLAAALNNIKTRYAAVVKNRVFAEPAHAVESYMQRVDALEQAMLSSMTDTTNCYRERLANASTALEVKKAQIIPEIKGRLENLGTRLTQALERSIERRQSRLQATAKQLTALSPLAVLERGYSITLLQDGTALRKASDAPAGTILTTRLSGGETVESTVGGITPQRPRQKKAQDGNDAPTLFDLTT